MSAYHAASMLSAHGLECVRGERRLFCGLQFEVGNGGLLQVRGANGSGKTSLLRMVCGFSLPASGGIEWNGSHVRAHGRQYQAGIAYVGHLNAVKEELDALDNLRLAARIAGLPCDEGAAEQSLRWYGIDDRLRLPCKQLSIGQRRRVALARLNLSGARTLWVLDEPFAALDEAGISLTCSLLEAHLARGGLVLLATHREYSIKAPAANVITLGS